MRQCNGRQADLKPYRQTYAVNVLWWPLPKGWETNNKPVPMAAETSALEIPMCYLKTVQCCMRMGYHSPRSMNFIGVSFCRFLGLMVWAVQDFDGRIRRCSLSQCGNDPTGD